MSSNNSNLKKKVTLPSYIKNRITLVRGVSFTILTLSTFFLIQNIKLLKAGENYKKDILSYNLDKGQNIYGIYKNEKVQKEMDCLGFLKTKIEKNKNYSMQIEGLIPFSPFYKSLSNTTLRNSKINFEASFNDLKTIEKLNLKLQEININTTANHIEISSIKENTNDYLVKTYENNSIKSAKIITKGMFYLEESINSSNNSSIQLFFPEEGLNYSKILKNIISKNNLKLIKLKNYKNFKELSKICSLKDKTKHPNNIDNSGILSLYSKINDIIS